MRFRLSALVFLAVLFGAASTASAAILHFSATLDCAQATTCSVPPCTGSGSGTFTLDTTTKMVSYSISFSGLSAAELVSHVHGPAAPGAGAGVVYGLPLGSPKVGTAGPLSTAAEADMIAGLHYVNVHSGNCVGGEIRGQINPCGDGSLGVGEQCDDGNLSNGDCCSDFCSFQPAQGVGGMPNCCSSGVCQTGTGCGAICFTSGALCMQAGGQGTPCTCALP